MTGGGGGLQYLGAGSNRITTARSITMEGSSEGAAGVTVRGTIRDFGFGKALLVFASELAGSRNVGEAVVES